MKKRTKDYRGFLEEGRKSILQDRGKSILESRLSKAEPIPKNLPTLCDACYDELMRVVRQANGYPFAGVYCPHELTLAQAELEDDGTVLGISLHGPLSREQAQALIDSTFEVVGAAGLVLPPPSIA